MVISATVSLVSYNNTMSAAINPQSTAGIVSRIGVDTQRTNMSSGGGCNAIQIIELSSQTVIYTTTYGYTNYSDVSISGTIIGIRLHL